MKRKSISLILSMLILVTCITPVFGIASAETIGNLSYSANVLIDDFNQDFEGFEAKEYEASEFSALTGLNASITGGNGTFKITEDGKAELTTTAQYSRLNLDYSIPSIQVGTVVAKFAFMRNDDSSPWHIFGVLGEEGTISSIQVGVSGYTAYSSNTDAQGATATSSVAAGMYNYTMVISRPDTSSDWSVVIYDTAQPVPTKIFNRIIKKEELARVNGIRLAGSYSTTEESLIGTFDNVSVKTYKSYPEYAQNFDELADVPYYTTGEFATAASLVATNDGMATSDGKALLNGNQEVKVFVPGVQKGLLEVSYALSPAALEDSGLWNIFSVGGHKQLYEEGKISDLTSTVAPAIISKKSTTADEADVFTADGAALSAQPTLSETTDMYHLRAKIYRTNTSDDWKAEIFDDGVELGYKVIYRGTLSASVLESITDVTLLSGTADSDATLTAAIDDIAVKYTKVSEIENFDISQDFENVAEGIYEADAYFATEERIEALTNVSLAKKTADAELKIADGKLDVITTAAGAEVEIEYELPMPISKGVIESRIKMSSEGNGIWAFFSINGEFSTIKLNDSSNFGIVGNGSFATLNFGDQIQPVVDADGMYNLRFVASRGDENSNWLITMYDETFAKGQRIVYTGTVAASVSMIDSLQILRGYSMGNLAASVDEISIRTYDIDETTAHELKANFNSANPDTYSVADFHNETGISPVAEKENAGMPVTVSAKDGKATIKTTGNGNVLFAKYRLPEKVFTGTIITKFKLDPLANVGKGNVNLFKYSCGDTNSIGDGITKSVTALQDKGDGRGFIQIIDNNDAIYIAPDKTTGMTHFAAMISRDDLNSDWTLSLYDQCEYAKKGNYHIICTTTISKEALPAIDVVVPFATSPTTAEGIELTIDDFEMKVIPTPDKNVIGFVEEFNDDFDLTNLHCNFADLYNKEHRIVFEGFDNYLGVAEASDGVLKVGGTADPYQRTFVKTYFPRALNDEVINVKMKFKMPEGNNIAAFALIDGSTATSSTTGRFDNLSFSTDGDGWSYAKVVIYNSASGWQSHIYDDYNNAYMTGNIFTNITNVTGITLINMNPAGGNPTLLIDNISVTCDKDPVPADAITPDGENITFDSLEFYANGDVVSAEELPEGTTELTAAVMASNKAGTKEYFSLILAVYDKDGRLLSIGAAPNKAPTAMGDYYEVTASGFVTEQGATAKVFFMNYMSTLSPLRAEAGLSEGF